MVVRCKDEMIGLPGILWEAIVVLSVLWLSQSHKVIKVAEVGVTDTLAPQYSSPSTYLPFLNCFHCSRLRVYLMDRDYFLKHLESLVYSPLSSFSIAVLQSCTIGFDLLSQKRFVFSKYRYNPLCLLPGIFLFQLTATSPSYLPSADN